MTYPDAIQFLYSLRLFGAKFGLDNTRKLAALAGNPQERLRFIHVAGTNGKGSTCAMLESVYRAAGLRVGLFSSPHLVSFAERIQVNRQLIPETEVARLVREIQPLLAQFSPDHHPTFFEVITVMALRYFEEQQCDLVIWETGLGGRLDATNIVIPLASAITNIGYDHQQWLGDTLAKIASEKAGVIKPGIPIISATEEEEARKVIAETARQQQAPLTWVDANQSHIPPLDTLPMPLMGEHQYRNAALALAVIRTLAPQLPVPDAAIRAGIQSVSWSGRLQQIPLDSGRLLLLDGAHNVPGAASLRAALEQHFPGKPITFILGILQDKDVAHICETLCPLASHLILAPVSSERTAFPALVREECLKWKPDARITCCSNLAEAWQAAANDPFIVITGSLYLVGEALELLHCPPSQSSGFSLSPASERGLNEWTGLKIKG